LLNHAYKVPRDTGLWKMDIKRERTGRLTRRHVALGLGVIALTAAVLVLATFDFRTVRVDEDKLIIGVVAYGDLDIKIATNGVLLAREVEYLSAEVDGRVTRLLARPGDSVRQGQLIAVLDNPSAHVATEQAAAALAGATAEKVSYQVELENALLNQRSALLQTEFALEKARLVLEANGQLAEKNIVSDIEYKKSQLEVRQLEQMYQLDSARFTKTEENMKSLLAVRAARVDQATQELQRTEERVRALEVLARMDGVIQNIGVEVGQQLQPGTEIGRIARQDLLYAELSVPERQASDIVLGQRVEVDTRNGVIEGKVSRIDPAVTAGTVLVDVELLSELPRSARPELAVEGTIYVTELKGSLYTGKPAFSKVNSRQTVYRLDEDGKYAERTFVDIGQASVNYIEILGGLKEGDRIVLSDSSEWQDHDKIMLY
jgi:HlyD family secretion protein